MLSKLGKRAGCGCSMVAADVQTRRVRAGAIFAALIAGLHARRRRARTA
jgi:F420-0:gamma-glutamyl ligase